MTDKNDKTNVPPELILPAMKRLEKEDTGSGFLGILTTNQDVGKCSVISFSNMIITGRCVISDVFSFFLYLLSGGEIMKT